MNNYFKYGISLSLLILAVVAFIFAKKENTGISEIAVNKATTEIHNTGNQLKNVSVNNDNALLTKTLIDIQNQLSELKTEVAEIKSSNDLNDQNSALQSEWASLISEISLDPAKQAKINDYARSLREKDYQETELYFDSLEVDEAWSNDAQSYLDNAVVTASESSGVRNGQFSSSECKGGMCKISFQAPVAVRSDGSHVEQFEFEHDFLVSMSKKFPRSRLATRKSGDSFVVEGFISDGNTSMPSNMSDMQNSGFTVEQVRAILQSQN